MRWQWAGDESELLYHAMYNPYSTERLGMADMFRDMFLIMTSECSERSSY